MLAEEAGRERITFTDLKRAVTDMRGPSDAAPRRVFTEEAPVRDGRKARARVAPPAAAHPAALPLPLPEPGSASAKLSRAPRVPMADPLLEALSRAQDFADEQSATPETASGSGGPVPA